MESATFTATRIRFDEFEADLHTQELRRDGRALRLPNQSFLVLATLLQQPGELVTREELRKRLWPKESYVDYDQALNAAVNRLRDALRDSADDPKYIETLPRRGYRFIGTIQPSSETVEQPTIATTSVAATQEPRVRRWVIAASVLALAIVAGVSLVTLNRSPTMNSVPRLEPLTSSPGRELAPAFSPDGRHVAFAWTGESQDGMELYVKPLDSDKSLRLTQAPAQWLSAAWSPNGQQLALVRVTIAESGIYLVPAPLGGDERRLLTAQFSASALTQVAWTSDGKHLVYAAFAPEGTLKLYRLSLDTLTPRMLQTDTSCWDMGSPAISPDGNSVAFICTHSVGVYSIYVIPASGGKARSLIRVMGLPQGLAWLDATRLIYANDAGDGGGLWQVTIDGTVARIPFGEEASMPSVSHRDGRVAYVRARETIDIWRVDLQAPESARVPTKLISSTRLQMNPQYSPDASKIAFQSNRSGTTEIWVANSDGSNPVRITNFDGPLAGAPTWCADGRRLAFDSRVSGVAALYIADVNERRARKVQTSVENIALPVWSSDCQWLIASNGNDALYLVPAVGGPARRFTTRPSYYASVLDDEVIFNVKQPNGIALWRKRIGESEESQLEGMPTLAYTDSWVAAGGGVYFTNVRADSTALHYYDFATRKISQILELPDAPAPAGGLGLSVSADQRWVLYTRTTDSNADIMMLSRQ